MYVAQMEERELEFKTDEVSEIKFVEMHAAFDMFRQNHPDYCPMSEQYLDLATRAIRARLESIPL